MDNWKELKKIAGNLFTNQEYKQAAEKYIIALQDLVQNNFSKFENVNPHSDDQFGLKTEAAKICSNISLMYLKLWETNVSENSICCSVDYGRKATQYDPTWFKGYLRLSKAYHSGNESDNAIDVMLNFMSCAKEKDIKLAKPYLKELKFYTIPKVIQYSPSWKLLNFPNNVYVIDPDGAGHFTNLDQLIAKYGNSITEASILVRPGVYIGTYSLENSKIDIVGDCSVDLDPEFNAITKDPPIVFRNVESPSYIQEAATFLLKQYGNKPIDETTFSFYNSEIQMKCVTVEDLIKSHPIHAVKTVGSNVDMIWCSIRSMYSASAAASNNSNLSINASIFFDVYGAVIISGKKTTSSLKDCIINNSVGAGVEVRGNAKLIKLDSCKISNTKRQGLVVYNGAKKANATNCFFEKNNIDNTVGEGAIQLTNCEAEITDTVIINQKAGGIVIQDGGSGEFSQLTIMNCYTAILVQAGVLIKECHISRCKCGIFICEATTDRIVLESNSIIECKREVSRCPTSPWPILEGNSKHQFDESGLNDAMAGTLFKVKRKIRRKIIKSNVNELNIGPVGEVLGLNEKLSNNPFVLPISRMTCEYCGYSATQVGHKLRVCGRCHMAAYCSKNCQKKAWKTHKQMCESYERANTAYKEKQHK